MINEGLSHEAIMDALIQPDSQPLTDTRFNCVLITSFEYEDDEIYDELTDEIVGYNEKLQKIAESLRDIYHTLLRHFQGSIETTQTGHIDADFTTPNQSQIDPETQVTQIDLETQMTPSTLLPKESEIIPPNLKEIDETFVEVLGSTEQNDPKIASVESMMNNMLVTLQSNSTQGDCNRFDLGLKHLGEILKDTNLTSLSLGGSEMSNDVLFEFAKNLPGTRIVSLELPKIVDKYWDSIREDNAICSSIDSRHVLVNCHNPDTSDKCVKKPKTTSVDSSRNEKVYRNGLEYLATVLKDTQITYIDFGGNPVNLKMLACSLIDTKITYLGLKKCKIQKDGLKCLARVLKYTQITSIDLSCNKLDCESLKIFASCLESTKIHSLNLSQNKIDIDGMNYLGHVLKDSQITSIDISYNKLTWKSLKIFASCLVGSKIVSLNLSGNYIDMNYLGHVLKDSQITSINISEIDLNCEMLKAFATCLVGSNITSINLSGNYIDIDGMNYLGHVLKDSQITAIDISDIDLDSDRLNAFAPYLVGSKIASLNLSRNDLSCNDLSSNLVGMSCLAHILKHTEITSIDISYTHLCLESLEVFVSCLVDTKLTSLILKGIRTTGINGLIHRLVTVLKDTQITSIDLSDSMLSCGGLKIFAAGLINSKLTSLNLSENWLRYEGIKCLISVLRNTSITELNIGDCSLTCIELSSLVMSLSDTNISTLNLKGKNYICCNYFYLASALEHTQVTSLHLGNPRTHDPITLFQISNSKVTSISHRNLFTDPEYHHIDCDFLDAGTFGYLCTFSFFYLAHILNNSKITALDIRYKTIENEGLKYLSQGFLGSQIDELDLNRCRLDCTGAYHLAQVLRQTRITSLNLAENDLCCEGVKYLAQGLEGSQITLLNLSSNCIKDEGIHYLAQVLRQTRITSLNLHDNRLRCVGVKYLAQGLEGSQITLLNLSHNCIKDEGIYYLAKSLVHTKIIEVDLRENFEVSEAAFEFFESIRQSKVNSFHVKIDAADTKWNLFKYSNCSIDIYEPELMEGVGDRIKNTYKTDGITQLILRGDYFPHLAGAFSNISISKAEFLEEDYDITPVLENSNIAELKMNWNQYSSSSFAKMKVIALHLQFGCYLIGFDLNIFVDNLKSLLVDSNIVYLDLSNNLIDFKIVFEGLVDVLNYSKIISLNLSNTGINAKRAKLLAKVLPNTKITYIDLHDNNIGNLGFKYLINIVDKTSICWLSLENNNIEEELHKGIGLSPYIVARNDTPIEFQIRYLFRELVSLNTSSQQFEFVIPREDSVMTINHYPRLVKHLLDTPSYNMHIYDYFYMQSKTHDIHVLNRINVFIQEIKQKFICFFEKNLMLLKEKFGYDCFVGLVKECEHPKMAEVVEFLLLHRVLYYVDDEQNFLHPFIYKMLHKHQMSLYSEGIEPNKKQLIISYFEKHSDIDGAKEIIDLLVSD